MSQNEYIFANDHIFMSIDCNIQERVFRNGVAYLFEFLL